MVITHVIFILFFFVLGACIGSFLNVIVFRVPEGGLKSLAEPLWSYCPRCKHKLSVNDNIPVFGWILLRGKCRYCGQPIAARYPIVEAITGLLFVFYYVMFFLVGAGPCLSVTAHHADPWFMGSMTTFLDDWPIFLLELLLVAALLASSLIDAELFIIPAEIPWVVAGIAILVHTIIDTGKTPGNVMTSPAGMALSAGATLGLLISIALLQLKILPLSFAEGGPLLEVEREAKEKEAQQAKAEGRVLDEQAPEYTGKQIRQEMFKEVLFLAPPVVLGAITMLLCLKVPAVAHFWRKSYLQEWPAGLLGSILGGLVGGFVVWATRILGSLAFGKEAMGLGDVHLMFAVGAVLGGGPATVAFFLAPFFGIALAIYMLLTGTRRQLPYGPYLSLATGFVMLFYGPIAAYLAPGLEGLVAILRQFTGV